MRIIIILTMLLSFNAIGANHDFWIDGHIGSIHKYSEFDYVTDDHKVEHYKLNQVNLGLGITFPAYYHSTGKPMPNTSYRFGFYHNSYNDVSLYGGINVHTEFVNGFGAGVLAGVVTGYGNAPNHNEMGGAIVPQVFYIHNDYKVEVSYLHSAFSPALTLTISYGF